MEIFNDLYQFAINVLYSLGDFCNEVFNLLNYSVEFGDFEFSVFEILFGVGLGAILIYKIILSLIPLA